MFAPDEHIEYIIHKKEIKVFICEQIVHKFVPICSPLKTFKMEVLNKKTGELYEGNAPFFQFREHNFKMIRKLTSENKIAAELFFFLIENMDKRTNSLIVSQESISEVLGYKRTAIYTAIKHLIEGKYVQVLKSGVNNVYCVNADIVWTKRADNLYHARFNTTVYLTSSEQDDEQKTKIKKTFERIINVEPSEKSFKEEPITKEEQEMLEAQFNIQ